MDINTDVFNTAFREELPATERSTSTARGASTMQTGSSDLDANSSGLNTVNSFRWPSDSGVEATTTSNSVSWYLETAREDSPSASTQSSSSCYSSMETAILHCSIEDSLSGSNIEACVTTSGSIEGSEIDSPPHGFNFPEDTVQSLGDGAADDTRIDFIF